MVRTQIGNLGCYLKYRYRVVTDHLHYVCLYLIIFPYISIYHCQSVFPIQDSLSSSSFFVILDHCLLSLASIVPFDSFQDYCSCRCLLPFPVLSLIAHEYCPNKFYHFILQVMTNICPRHC